MTAVGDFHSRMSSSQAVPETASCSVRMTSPDSREKVSTSQHTRRRNPHLPLPRKINTSLPASRRMCRVPPAKRGNNVRAVVGPHGFFTKYFTKYSPQAKEQLDKHDTEDHSISSKHKDRSCSDKCSRHSSDKESSSTSCKHALSPLPGASSAECPC